MAWACDYGDENPKTDNSKAYFPLTVGQYQIYSVHEVRYSEVSDPDTLDYELITEVVDSFKNSVAGYTYVIHRSTRTNVNTPWQFLDTWSARLEDNKAVVSEGNQAFIKIVFPSDKGAVWDGNSLNNLEKDNYKILDSGEPGAVGELAFQRTVTVEQELNDDPIVFTDLRMEVYAQGVGLVSREATQLHYCTREVCDRVIESGVILQQKIKEYGVH
jgi:hypothetical protein